MAFLGSDPLSELVWSPRKGLILQSPVGPTEMVYSPPYSFATENNNAKVAKERNLIALLPTISPVEKDVADEPTRLVTASKSYASNLQMCDSDLGCDPGSGEKMAEMNTSSQKSNALDSVVAPNSLREEDTACKGNTIRVVEATGSSSPGLEDGRTSNVKPVSDGFDLNTKPIEFMSGGLTDMKMCGSFDINKDSSQTYPLSPIKGNLLQEVKDLRIFKVINDLILNPSFRCKDLVRLNNCLLEDGGNKMMDTVSPCALPRENLGTAGNKLQSSSDSDLGIRNNLQVGKEQFQLEACPVSKASPIRYFTTKRKGKEHVMYDGDMKDEDPDSYGSVNSFYGARKRRELNFEEQSNDGCKRVKLEIGETPMSTSFTRSDGSFVNWISALMKGFSRPNENKTPSPADAGSGSEKEELMALSRVQEDKCGNMGFQSLFESMYQRNLKAQDQRLLSSIDPYVSQDCKELEAVEKFNENYNHPTRTSGPDDRMTLELKKVVLDKSLNQSAVGDEKDPPIVPSVPFDCKTALPKRVSSTENSAMAEHVGCLKKFTVSDKVDELVKKYNQLSHSWLTHFCPKPSGVSAEFSRFCHNRRDNTVSFKNGKDTASQGNSSKGPTNSSCKKLQDSPLDVEVSCGMKRIEGKKYNSILRSYRFKCSEAMASIFAKRLDAVKQILQAGMAGKATSSATTCFFCGVIGHDLRDCPQLTDTEVDELINEITTCSGAEESPCFCIRCFQLNHWAVACPNAPTVKESQLEHGAVVLHRSCLGETSHLELPVGTHEQTRHVNLEITESSALLRRSLPNLEKVGASYVEQNASEAITSVLPHPYSSFGRQVVDKPRGIFEAVKGLRLSRTDILKWMYSMVSISYLDGYYLRLRLGKPGDGVEGTGYHVACISGIDGEKSVEASKNPISVIVGGIRCSIESQFISNQDFLEDELMAWWSVTKKGSGKLPTEDELRSKVEERRMLGL